MAKFNGTKKVKPTGKNMAGGASYDRTAKKEIASVVLNSMLTGKDQYYESEEARLQRIAELITSNTAECAEFIAKCAVYTRNEGRLRSVSHLMSVMLIENVKGESFTRKALEKIMLRPDDATEIVALWNQRNPNKMIPNALRRAIKHNLEHCWDLYQLKKYAQLKAKVKVKDLVKMCRPNPKIWNKKFSEKYSD